MHTQRAHAEYATLVASERAGYQAYTSFFVAGIGENAQFDTTLSPRSLLTRQDTISRRGPEVRLRFAGADPTIPYQVELDFLSDAPRRVVAVFAGTTCLETRLDVPNAELLRRRWAVPAEVINDGVFEISVRAVDGPDAIVTAVQVWAASAAAGPLQGTTPPDAPPAPASRLTPPSCVPGQEMSLQGAWEFYASIPERWATTATATGRGDIAQEMADNLTFVEAINTNASLQERLASTSVAQDLGGSLAAAPEVPAEAWQPIQVPGEWVMQGFRVNERHWAKGPLGPYAAAPVGWYRRRVPLPAAWAGQRLLWQCDSIYSAGTLWVNGRQVHAHEGPMVPFECDITDVARVGEDNEFLIGVKTASLADYYSWIAGYAAHDTGGILRETRLRAVPTLHIAALHVETTFDAAYHDAVLHVTLRVANDGSTDVAAPRIRYRVTPCWRMGHPIDSAASVAAGEYAGHAIAAGETSTLSLYIPVAQPDKWDAEHPNLYRLDCELVMRETRVQHVAVRLGFREVVVRDGRLWLNGHPLKLRGVCRHSTHPTHGRALPPELDRQDVRLFREANVNCLRTSHYPPSSAFLDACDELGMLVECEAPCTWNPGDFTIVPATALAMVEAYRNHPSIIMWSTANESPWSLAHARTVELVRAADPSRPIIFGHHTHIGSPLSHGRISEPPPGVDFHAWHYPWLDNIGWANTSQAPHYYDEMNHVCCYNRQEYLLDPGVRDLFGPRLTALWELLYRTKHSAGGAIWSGIDDFFVLPWGDVAGYGLWGIVDSWRRPKPEYWHTKKVYSPLRMTLLAEPYLEPIQSAEINVENRSVSADLAEYAFHWTFGPASGILSLSGGPGAVVQASIPTPSGMPAGMPLSLKAYDAMGYLVDEECWQVRSVPPPPAFLLPATPLTCEQVAGRIRIRGARFAWEVDAGTGLLTQGTVDDVLVLHDGPALLISPGNAVRQYSTGGYRISGQEPVCPLEQPACSDWHAASVTVTPLAKEVVVTVCGQYAGYAGAYTMTFDPGGRATIQYLFTASTQIEQVRQYGLVFTVDRACGVFTWQRDGEWTTYPDDHIGRSTGTAYADDDTADWESGVLGPLDEPSWSWSKDRNGLGTNDFRATKRSMRRAALTDQAGHGVGGISDGRQAVRCWKEAGHLRLFIADYSGLDSEPFNHEYVIPFRGITPGDLLTGVVQLQLLGSHPQSLDEQAF